METIDDIVREMRDGDWDCSLCDDECDCPNATRIMNKLADRIEKAWRQDMMAFGKWLKERHNLNVLSEEMERYVERELERDYGNDGND